MQHASEGFANILELLENYDRIRNAPMGNQMEASTTALTAASAEGPFTKAFAFTWYTTPTLIRLRYSPTQELCSLKLFPYHFERHGAVKITAGV